MRTDTSFQACPSGETTAVICGSKHPAPYSRYRFNAVVDWIELRIVTANPTNFPTVRRRMDLPHVKAVDAGEGGAATCFLFKIHDPKSWAEIDAALARLTVDHPLAEPITVTGIEIALDAYSKQGSRADLTEMVLQFYRASTKMISRNRRVSNSKIDLANSLTNVETLRRRLEAGYNIYIGDKGTSASQHLYLKETDKKALLPTVEQRARTEITLRGESLPHVLLEDWKRHSFTQEADYFKYRKIKHSLHPMVEWAAQRKPQFGEKYQRRRATGGVRHFSSATRADLHLNALALDALRYLNEKMNAPLKTT
jgi:hypothetical protein